MVEMTVQKALELAKEKLAGSTDTARIDGEVLLANILKKPRSFLYSYPNQVLSSAEKCAYDDYLERRSQCEPIAYILGKKEFWSLMLEVTPDTLIPRPETELLVEQALSLFGATTINQKVADLGTGSGAIALALAKERPTWQLYATDISLEALKVARKNAQQLAINNISFYQGNWCTALPDVRLDMIISNPPYIAFSEWEDYAAGLAYEPLTALVSGKDGLDAIREICQQSKQRLKAGGYLLLEHGFSQGLLVREIFNQEGYSGFRTVTDLAGRERVTIGQVG